MDADYFNLKEYRRVFKLLETPDLSDFKRVAMITGGGSVLIGIIGTIIFVLMNLPTVI